MPFDYTEEEVAVIRRAIAPPPPKPPEQVIEAMRPGAGMPVPEHMPPFWKLSDLEMPLFPQLTGDPTVDREEAHYFVRTPPMYRVFRGMAEDESHVDRFLEEYAGKLAAASKSEIMSRDLAFAQQGLKLAARQLADGIIEPVEEGFKRAYSW